jgi:DNA-binding transcriptional MerR regulator
MPTREQQFFGNPRKTRTAPRGQFKGKKEVPQTPEDLERIRKALSARRRGFTWDNVAKAAGYKSGASAAAACKRQMNQLRADVREDVESLRELEVSRLDRALVEITNMAFDRDLLPERRLVALEALRRNVESRAKLQNLYPAAQVEVITISQIERRVAELSHQLGVPVPRELLELPAGGDDDGDEGDEYEGDWREGS